MFFTSKEVECPKLTRPRKKLSKENAIWSHRTLKNTDGGSPVWGKERESRKNDVIRPGSIWWCGTKRPPKHSMIATGQSELGFVLRHPRWFSGKNHRFNPVVGRISPGGGNGNPLYPYCTWKFPWAEGPAGLRIHGASRVQKQLSTLWNESYKPLNLQKARSN